MRKLSIVLTVLFVLMCVSGCGKKIDRTLYDDGPEMDSSETENFEPFEGDPYATGQISSDYAQDILNRLYSGIDSDTGKFNKIEYADTVTENGAEWYRFKKLSSVTENGNYEFVNYIYYKTDGSEILSNK